MTLVRTLEAFKRERIVNIKELQKSPSRHLKHITRITKGAKTLGYFLDASALDDLLEDLEALASPKYLKSIARARKNKKVYTLDEVKKRYGIL